MRNGFFLLLCLIVFFGPLGISQAQDITSRIAELQEEALKTERELTNTKVRLRQIASSVEELEETIEFDAAEILQLEDQATRLKEQIDRQQQKLNDVQRERIQTSEVSERRLRSLYIRRFGGQQLQKDKDLELGAEELGVYLLKIREFDDDVIHGFDRVLRRERNVRSDLEESLQNYDQITEALLENKTLLESKRLDLKLAQVDMVNQEKELAKLLDKVKSHRIRLEAVLASLSTSSASAPRKAPFLGRRSDVDLAGLSGIGNQPFAPVPKKCAREVKDKKVLAQNCKGSSAFGVATGRVVYDGVLPGVGAALILGHGEGEYSLYAPLRDRKFGRGDLVERGEVLGEVDSSTFIVELRKGRERISPSVLQFSFD